MAKITTLAQLTKYTEGQVVELPSFAEDQPFIARLRRPSMLELVKSGKIPNELLNTANDLFIDGKADKDINPEVLKNVFEVIDILCEASFVEPRYSEIKAAGITLTDEQYMFVFQYTQQGVKALQSFRQQP